MEEKKSFRPVSEGSCINFDFHRNRAANRSSSHQAGMTLWKHATPSKWDDAQKWLVNLSRGDKNPPTKALPRNSISDDRRLIASSKEHQIMEAEKGCESYSTEVGCVSVRDMGTEMTPIGSQEPSRTTTPMMAATPATQSPNVSGSSTPIRGVVPTKTSNIEKGADILWANGRHLGTKTGVQQRSILNPLETRAMAWDEAEHAKYMARYKREEMKIQAWEDHQKMKAERVMRKVEAKAERLKSQARERCAVKLATIQRIADEGRANAEAKLNKKALKTSERVDYIRRTGHLPRCFSHKFPSYCW